MLIHSTDADGRFLWSKNIEADLGVSKTVIDAIFDENWLNILKGKRDVKEHVEQVFKAHPIPDTLNAPVFLHYWLSRDNYINPSMLELVYHLSVPIYLGTNQERYRTAHLRETLARHFHGVYSSSELGFAKPEPEFYEAVEKDLELKPEALMLIDDQAYNVAAAKARGWQAYHYQGDTAALAEFLGV